MTWYNRWYRRLAARILPEMRQKTKKGQKSKSPTDTAQSKVGCRRRSIISPVIGSLCPGCCCPGVPKVGFSYNLQYPGSPEPGYFLAFIIRFCYDIINLQKEKVHMKKTFSLLLAFALCLSMCACGNKSAHSNKIDTLMNDFEWGQSYAQVQKNLSDHNHRFEVFGKQVQRIFYDCEKDKPLSGIEYEFYRELIPLSDDADKDPMWDLLKKDYSALKQSLTEMFGDPDIDEYEYDYNAVSVTEFAVWYIDNDIVTLTLHKYFVWNEWSASLLLEIEHTTQIQSVVQDSSFKS